MDNGIHTLDLICHLLGGEVTHVSGMVSTDIWKLDRSEDNAFVHLRTKSGALGSLHSSWSEWKGYHFYVEAYGDCGMARAYYAPMQATVITMDKPGGKQRIKRHYYPGAILKEKIFGWQSTVVQTFVEELEDFVRFVAGDESGVIATASDGLRSIAIPNAVYDSSDQNRIIPLESYLN